MHIQLESSENNTISSYTEEQITIGNSVYQQSTIISRHEILSPWPIHSILALNETTLAPLLTLNPEIIIIGHQEKSVHLPMIVMNYLSKQRIGIECMSLGAASRTFNVLLSEQRKVVAGIVFKAK